MTMRAVTITDGCVVVAEHDDLIAQRGEVLVKVTAAGLNGADILQMQGKYPAPAGSPQEIPGLEFAGTIVQLGVDSQRFAVGDRVMGIVGGGGQAQQIVVHESQLCPVPQKLSDLEAGGFCEAYFTAFDALVSQAQIQAGEHLLINGAAGGVGTAAIQIAKAFGLTVTASTRHPGLAAQLKDLGADRVVAAGDESIKEFDVALELVGAPDLPSDLKRLNTGGRIVVIGVGGGFKTELNLLILMNKRAKLMGSTLRARPLEQKATLAQQVTKQLIPLLERGLLTVPVHTSFDLAEVAAAYEAFQAGSKLGKIVLQIS